MCKVNLLGPGLTDTLVGAIRSIYPGETVRFESFCSVLGAQDLVKMIQTMDGHCYINPVYVDPTGACLAGLSFGGARIISPNSDPSLEGGFPSVAVYWVEGGVMKKVFIDPARFGPLPIDILPVL